MIEWIKNITDNIREQIAWKIFPEFSIYLEVAKLVGANLNNEENIKLLEEADSSCSAWAVGIITPKQYNAIDLKDLLTDEKPL